MADDLVTGDGKSAPTSSPSLLERASQWIHTKTASAVNSVVDTSLPPSVATTATPKIDTPSPSALNANSVAMFDGLDATSLKVAPTTKPEISSVLANASIEQLLKAKVKPNILNDFLLPTYHFRLFITKDDELYKQANHPTKIQNVFEALDSGKIPIITIAETGVTTYNIKDVSLLSQIGPNSLTRNVNFTEITLTIVEPMAVGFLEALKVAAEALGIRNYLKCSYYLELNFLGWEEDGSASLNPLASGALGNGGRWLWPLSITKIDTKLDTSGGVYTVTAMPFNETALFNDEKALNLHHIPEALAPEGDTIGEMLDSFQAALNESWYRRYGGDLVKFKFVMHKLEGPLADTAPASLQDPRKYKLRTLAYEKNSVTNFSLSQVNGKYRAAIPTGTQISDFIDYAFANSEDGQHVALDRGNAQGQTTNPNKAFRESVIFRIEPELEIRDFDYGTDNYIRTITYHIIGYYTQAAIVDKEQLGNALIAKNQYDMMKAQLDKGFIAKRYDYLYTGLNTEVLDFDIHFNFQWNAMLPKLEGALMGAENAAYYARANETNTTPQGNLIEAKLKVLKNAVDQTTADLNSTSKSISNAKNALEIQKQNLITHPSASNSNSLRAVRDNIDNLLDVQTKQVAVADQAKQNYNAAMNSVRQEVQIPKNSAYAEEIVAQQSGASGDRKFLSVPVSLAQNYQDSSDTTGTGFIGQYHRDKSVFGSVLGQLYTPDFQNLVNIELGIRGDPYWLGNTALERQPYLRSYDPSNPSADPTLNDGLPDTWMGDQVILLYFRYPIRIGDDYEPVFKEDDVISSLYRVSKVRNTFADGVFKQTLSASKLPLAQLVDALGYSLPNANASNSSGGPLAKGPLQNGTPSGPLVPSSATFNQQAPAVVNNLMKDFNLTREQASGIVGNLGAESNLQGGLQEANPTVPGSRGGLGWAQWTGDRRVAFEQYASANKLDPASAEANYGYLKQELMTTESASLAAIKMTSTVGDATNAFQTNFERAGIVRIADRLSAAQTAFKISNVGTGTSGST